MIRPAPVTGLEVAVFNDGCQYINPVADAMVTY